jgi:exopolyphosphatase/guanosine-5'-triphosphate,3'-diphosphate pyrophosphatase
MNAPHSSARREIWELPARVGIIDVGSNTVRLVAYDAENRLPQLIFNEKAFCGLGRTLATTGMLDPDGVKMALTTIRRFVTLARQMGVAYLDMVATAAVRDADNGKKFVNEVQKLTGHRLRVVTGKDEARYSALGVMAGINDVDGVAADLGGGSLELLGVKNGSIGTGVSLPLGTLRLMDAHADSRSAASKEIDARLDSLDWLKSFKGRNFYAVGGTWRALARLHMASQDYPLRILHHYEIQGNEAQRFARDISKFTSDTELYVSGVSRKRVATLPIAALVLYRLLKRLQPDKLVVSALGLREGILFDHAAEHIQELDPLIEFCRDLARRRSRFPAHGEELMRWIEPVFQVETPAQNRLRYAVCLLSDIGWSGHPEYRAELAMDQIMLAQMNGLDHPGRAFMGLALFLVNGGSIDDEHVAVPLKLLRQEEVDVVRRIGLALRLGQRLSGGTRELLNSCWLSHEEGRLALVFKRENEFMIGEAVEKRLNALASVIGKEPVIRLEGESA